jgi:hypothetical protein
MVGDVWLLEQGIDMRLNHRELLGVTLVTAVGGLYTDDWLISASILVLWLVWKLTATHDGMFVVSIALTFQWVQSTIGLFYLDLLGRSVDAVHRSDWRPMVMIGLGCCLTLAIGISLGLRLVKAPPVGEDRPEFAFPFKLLMIVYVVTIVLEGGLNTAVREFPSLRQIVVTFDEARLAVLYLLLRRFYRPVPQWGRIAAVVGFEVTLGITGFFAGFREPLVLTGLAMLEVFDHRNVRHWTAAAAVGMVTVAFGLVWMGIRTDYRRDYVQMDNFKTDRGARIARIGDLASGFLRSDSEGLLDTLDNFVDRMWPIYYPALAVSRVPSVLPHTDGTIFSAAVKHITMPRVFFPDKGELASDSEMVRKYSGMIVAGAETGTSIAFGYAAESYVDFGLPWMFLPVFGFAVVMGMVYRSVARNIRHRELLVAYSTVTFWFALYLFERSWVVTLGEAAALLVYVGTPIVLLDRFLLVRHEKQQADPGLLFPESGRIEI